MMKMNLKNFEVLALLAVLIIGVAFISGCVGEGPDESSGGEGSDESSGGEEQPTGNQNDANSGGDVPADLASPYRIESGTEYSGTLDGDDDGDAYTVSYKSGDVVCIRATSSSGLDIMLWCAEFSANDGIKGEEENLCVGSDSERTDITRIDVLIGAVSGTGNYVLEVTMTPQNDGNSGGDAGATFVIPVKLEQGTYPDCHLGYGDQSDTYKVSLAPGQTATIRAIPSSNLDIFFNRGGSIDNTGVKGEEETITIESGGDITKLYDFGVEVDSREPGTYTLEVSVE